MVKMNLRGKIRELLRSHPNRKFSAREITETIIKEHPELCRRKRQESAVIKTDRDLFVSVHAGVGNLLAKLPYEEKNIKMSRPTPRLYSWRK